MEQLDASRSDDAQLAQSLHTAVAPIMLRNLAAFSVRTLAALLSLYGGEEVAVVTEGGVYRGGAKAELTMPLSEVAPAMRNGSLPEGAYVFLDVSERPLGEVARELSELLARVSLLRNPAFAAMPRAARGRPILSVGGWGGGRPFHAHGPALNGLLGGAKHWFVRRPNASEAVEVPRGMQHGTERLPQGWAAQLWQCTQRAGDVVWVLAPARAHACARPMPELAPHLAPSASASASASHLHRTSPQGSSTLPY